MRVPLSRFPRNFSLSGKVLHGDFEWEDPKSPEEVVNITYVDRNDIERKISGKVGDNVMFLAHRDDIDEITEEEEDMLDMAPYLQENSRLCCQIVLNKKLEGLVVRLPSATRNFWVDGATPEHH